MKRPEPEKTDLEQSTWEKPNYVHPLRVDPKPFEPVMPNYDKHNIDFFKPNSENL